MDVKLPEVGNVFWHTCHCVQNEDKTTDVIVCGGQDWDLALKPIFTSFRLGNGDELLVSVRFSYIYTVPIICIRPPWFL